MSDVTRRILRLLALLQSRATWSGEELAVELGVTTRSVRRDIDRLRDLGYPVFASTGHGGGYQLGPGRSLPPLLLEGDEAVAIIVGLRLAAASGIDGIADCVTRALVKIDQVIPPAQREAASAVAGSVRALSEAPVPVDMHILTVLTRAARDRVLVDLAYERRDGAPSSRRVQPYRVLTLRRRWYLFAWDEGREDWRTFRLDRMHQVRTTTFRFTSRPHPDIDEHARRSITHGPRQETMRVRVLRPALEVTSLIPASVGQVTPEEGDSSCLLEIENGDPRWTAVHLAMLDLPIQVLGPPALADAIADLARWFTTNG